MKPALIKSILILTFVYSHALSFGQALEVEDYAIRFMIKNAGLEVEGEFEKADFILRFYPDNIEKSYLEGKIDVASLNSGIALRDSHLMGEEYFHQKKFRTIHMKSLSLSRVSTSNNHYSGVFLLVIKEKSKEITLPFTFQNKQLKAQFELDRRDFGVGGSSFIMSDNVKVEILVNVR
ncbi:YceI family protein [Cytophagales bacterium LB-30]|uniref:YceI family protein n=1 Tax=Shiella aurantiaca TaxID=3058365 RepID=A0ABT8F1D2_9BACT|nr:YceI family protein [Shiella aurantiaca]MDN4164164.1 YceI family protein [Shiella aurantiaca]